MSLLGRRNLLFGSAVSLVFDAKPAVAAEAREGRIARSLLRALAYDRNLKARSGDLLTLAVVYRPHDGPSEASRDALGRALSEVTREGSVDGLRTRTIAAAFDDDFERRLNDHGVSAILLSASMDTAVEPITSITRRRATLSFSESKAYVQAGVSVGLVPGVDGALALVVNLPAARAEGAHFDPSFLKFAEILR